MVVTASASGIELLKKAYSAFNSRDIDGALATMKPDVVWPNGWKAVRFKATMASGLIGPANGA